MTGRRRRVAVWVAVAVGGGVALLGGAPLLVPVPALEGTVPPRDLADTDSRFVDVDGLAIHTKQAGTGDPPLVLLHGFAASTFSWHEVMPALSQDHQVVAFDRPGFGLTERPLTGDWDPSAWPGGTPYGAEAQVKLTVDLLDRMAIEKAVLVGHSAGGTVAAMTALERPERVTALVLVDPALFQTGAPRWAQPFLRLPQVRHLAPLLLRRLPSHGSRLVKSAWYDPTKVTPELMAGYIEPTRANNWDRALVELVSAPPAPSLGDRLGEIRVPTLVVTGDHDTWVSPERSRRAAALITGAELVVIPHSGHLPHEEQPRLFLEAVGRFLDRLP